MRTPPTIKMAGHDVRTRRTIMGSTLAVARLGGMWGARGSGTCRSALTQK
jgi:hypothetical protein